MINSISFPRQMLLQTEAEEMERSCSFVNASNFTFLRKIFYTKSIFQINI